MTLRLNNDNGNSASIDYVDGVSTDITVTIPEVADSTFIVSDTNGDVSIGGGDIELNADGSAEFSSQVLVGGDPNDGSNPGAKILSRGMFLAARQTADAASAVWSGYVEGTTDATSRINADGSAQFTEIGAASAENIVPLSIYRPTTTLANNVAHFRSDVGGTDTIKVIIDANGSVLSNGTALTSDQRLKTAIVDADPQWNDIKALKLRNYEWLAEPGVEKLGLVAQEVEATSPGLVDARVITDEETGEVESETKAIKFDPLVYKMLGALQQAMTRIETLEAEVQALKGDT